jgi:hypothetical protein
MPRIPGNEGSQLILRETVQMEESCSDDESELYEAPFKYDDSPRSALMQCELCHLLHPVAGAGLLRPLVVNFSSVSLRAVLPFPGKSQIFRRSIVINVA